jgi:hypothetical protein
MQRTPLPLAHSCTQEEEKPKDDAPKIFGKVIGL